MRYKRANIDSLNLSSEIMEAVFIFHEDFTIETVKSRIIFNPKVWRKTFGRALTKSIIEAKIIHTHLGLTLLLKVFARTPKKQTIEFAGLHSYNERSELLLQTLEALRERLLNARVTRMDVAIDFNGNIPKGITKALSKLREPFRYGNTTYWKTKKEKKTNRRMDIKIYDKAHQAGLDYPLMRLEFVFRAEYLKELQLKDIETVYQKMEKTIKRITGLNIKINHILDLKK